MTPLLLLALTASAKDREAIDCDGRVRVSEVRDLLAEATDRYPGPERYPEANQQAFEAKAQEAFAALRCVDAVLDARTALLMRLVEDLYNGRCDEALRKSYLADGLSPSDLPKKCAATDEEVAGAATRPETTGKTRRIQPPILGRFTVDGGEPVYDPAHSYVLQRLDGNEVRRTEFVPAGGRPEPYVRLRPVLGGVVAGTAAIAGAALAGAWALDQQVNGTTWNHSYHSPDELRTMQSTNHALVITAIASGALSLNAAVGLGLSFR